ncbi:MAG: hypothetical protein J6Y47_07845 [Bacteroidales bacterium]|nr:hypothetical protein [Bacteroidales bacterium]
MEIVLTLFYVLLFMVLIYKLPYFQSKNISSFVLCVLFGIKVLAGVSMYFVYTYYYPDRSQADIFRYFDDAKVIYNALPERPMDYLRILLGIGNDTPYFNDHYYVYLNHWEREIVTNIFSDSHIIIRFNALVMLFSFGYFNVHNVFASFIAFVGLFAMYKFMERHTKHLHIGYMIAIFLLPSVMFWTSGVLKESVIIFGVGLFVYGIDSMCEINMPWYRRFMLLASAFLGALLLIYTKLYYLLLLLLLMTIFIINKYRRITHPLWTYIIAVMIAVPLMYGIACYAGYDALDLIAYKHNDMLNLGLCEHAQMADTIRLEATLPAFASYVPHALFNAIFKPLPFSSASPMVMAAWAENMLLWIVALILLCIGGKWQVKNKNIFYFCVLFFLANALVIGLSVPIVGAIARYRCISLPFGMLAVCLCLDEYTMHKRWKALQKKCKRQ